MDAILHTYLCSCNSQICCKYHSHKYKYKYKYQVLHFSFQSTNVWSTLEAFLVLVRYINLRFTYLFILLTLKRYS